MKILFYNNGSGLGTAKSGGTTRHIETARILQKKGVNLHIVTTEGAHTLYKKEKLKPDSFTVVRAHLLNKKENSPFDRALSYVVSTIHSCLIVFKLPKVDILYSTSDYFCDVIPAVIYNLLRPKVKWVIMIHHLCKSPFKRKGNFVLNTASYLFQRFTYLLVKLFADDLLVYDTPEGESIAKLIFGSTDLNKIHYVYNGIDVGAISKVRKPKNHEIYEACFAGGLRVTKGINDLVPVWSKVVKKRPDARIAIAGAGTKVVTKALQDSIEEAGLKENIVLLGALPSIDLYKLLKSSKVFVSVSHEEGWGIAVCEALACSAPVIAYDLPAFKFLEDKITKIPRYNHSLFAKKIVSLLNSDNQRKKQGSEGKKFVAKFDWKSIGIKEHSILLETYNDLNEKNKHPA